MEDEVDAAPFDGEVCGAGDHFACVQSDHALVRRSGGREIFGGDLVERSRAVAGADDVGGNRGHPRFETVVLSEPVIGGTGKCIRLRADGDEVAQGVKLEVIGAQRCALERGRTIARRAAEVLLRRSGRGPVVVLHVSWIGNSHDPRRDEAVRAALEFETGHGVEKCRREQAAKHQRRWTRIARAAQCGLAQLRLRKRRRRLLASDSCHALRFDGDRQRGDGCGKRGLDAERSH